MVQGLTYKNPKTGKYVLPENVVNRDGQYLDRETDQITYPVFTKKCLNRSITALIPKKY
jgi:hypothetical protein